MPSKRAQIEYMITIYITAHGRAETEGDSMLHFTDRDVYIGQETGNCSVQAKEYDKRLLETVTNWSNETKWLKSGANIDFVEYDDYKIGPYKFEDETQVMYTTQVAMVGPAYKKDKIINMEGKSDELSRPGVVIMIQEKDNTNPQLNNAAIRNILRKIYTKGDHELGIDPTNHGHRFSAIYMNNKLIESNNNTPTNILSKEFNDYILTPDELSLSDIIETSKVHASKIIGLKPNNKRILYIIADTTCNVYTTDDIDETPEADQDQSAISKSATKAKQLGRFLDHEISNTSDSNLALIAVTPSHGTDYWYSGTQTRLRMRQGDLPSKEDPIEAITEEDEVKEDEAVDEIEDALINSDIYIPGTSSIEFPGLTKQARKKAPKKKHQDKSRKYREKPKKHPNARKKQKNKRRMKINNVL